MNCGKQHLFVAGNEHLYLSIFRTKHSIPGVKSLLALEYAATNFSLFVFDKVPWRI